MKNLKQILILGVLAVTSIAIGLWAGMQGRYPTPTSGYADLGGDFTLMSDRGPVSLQDLRGDTGARGIVAGAREYVFDVTLDRRAPLTDLTAEDEEILQRLIDAHPNKPAQVAA